MTILEKLAQARKLIREANIKKLGHNSYSNYDYFTPEQVEGLVSDACEKTGLICLTNLRKDQYGYFQELELAALDSEEKGMVESLKFELRTETPEIKATNAAQQMGGMDTYSERYIKMKVFQIKDNNLDFDSHDNRPKPFNAVKARKVEIKQDAKNAAELDLGNGEADNDF